jgi:hypothetical protein
MGGILVSMERSHMKNYQTPSFVINFYRKLVEKYGEDVMADWRRDLGFLAESDDEWLEYCFSSESPF